MINPNTMGLSIQAPIVEIISMTSEPNDMQDIFSSLVNTTNIIDLIWSIDGLAILPHQETTHSGTTTKSLPHLLGRPKNDSFTKISSGEWSSYIQDRGQYVFSYEIHQDISNPEKILAVTLGWLTFIF